MHVPLLHPIIAAKQMATVDHVGRGRLGVNVVCGWNEDEFQMFGVDKHEHDDRYAQGDEWWTIIRRIWSGEAAFDFRGRFYDLAGVQGQPTPYAGERPLMMNAGTSPRGRAVRHRAVRHALRRGPLAGGQRDAHRRRKSARARPGRRPAGLDAGRRDLPTDAQARRMSFWIISWTNADLGRARPPRGDARQRRAGSYRC